jgi:alanine racemase
VSRPAKVTINLAALKHNLDKVRQYAPQSQILAVLKANAYGHGLTTVALALSKADTFGVCCIEEALELRAVGIKKAILLMEGFFTADELPVIVNNQFETVIHHWPQIVALEQATLSAPIKVWLKLDSGMHRLGFSPSEFLLAWERLNSCPNVQPLPILMTHFASSDDLKSSVTDEQLLCFNQTVNDLPGQRSLANSAAILARQPTCADWVRAGIMLYGISPFSDLTGQDYGLQPAMTFSSELIAIHSIQQGQCIGYGGTWRCPENMLVGVVAVGYGDGYPRHAENFTPVLVNGKKLPLVGRVSMDMVTVDLRTQPQAKVGDPVILWGEALPVEKVAACADTIAYELVCGISKRVCVKAIGGC